MKSALLLIAILVASTSASAAEVFSPSPNETYTIDQKGRLLAVNGRSPIPCPKQSKDTAVLLIAGQSNTGNHAEVSYRTSKGPRVVNFFGGRCYPAASPLLGTTGMKGEPWVSLADKLIDAGLYHDVVLITSGIGGTAIDRWQDGADLNQMLMEVVATVGRHHYKITHVLWHQGESDLFSKTSASEYTARFSSLVASLRAHDVKAPIFVSVASKCGGILHTWSEADPVSEAQKALVNPTNGIYAGPDTNTLIPAIDRYDQCHFGKSGQEKFASAWVDILRANHHR